MGPAFVAGEGTPFALIIVPVEAHGAMTHAMPTSVHRTAANDAGKRPSYLDA
jgi:hypothetical protein